MKAIWLAAFAALWGWRGTAAAVGSIADVSVYDRREGRVLPVHRHAGRVYIAGTDIYRNLVAQGVIRARAALPEPFPGRFVPDPR